MTSTTRSQNKYDHRLRELVRSTGDIDHAIKVGVPRSTARGWLTSTGSDVVTLDVADMDNLRLQQEVLRMQRRGDRLAALLRLVSVVLKLSGVSLSSIRIPEGTAKRLLLRAIERSCCALPLKVALNIVEKLGTTTPESRLDSRSRPGTSTDTRDRIIKNHSIPPPQTSSGENSRRKLQKVVTDSTALFHQLEVTRHPGFIKPWLQWPIESQEYVKSSARHGLIALVATSSCRQSTLLSMRSEN